MDQALITDTSVLLNILATGCAEEIFGDAGWGFSVCRAVLSETLLLRNRDTQECCPAELAPFIERRLLTVLEISGDDEYELLADFTALMGRKGDGEAMCFALAESRSLPLAIDDERAVKRAKQRFQELTVLSTPDILQSWQRMMKIEAKRMGGVLRRIQTWANYFPGPRHPAYAWWQSQLGIE